MSEFKVFYRSAIHGEVKVPDIWDNKNDAIQYSIELYENYKLMKANKLINGVIAVIVKENDIQIWQNGPL